MAFSLLDLQRVISELRRRLRVLEIKGNSGIIKTGVASERPASPTLFKGVTVSFYASDTKVFSIWNVVNEEWDEVTLT